MAAKNKTYGSVNASPVKSFFVDMLTRDISLDDAILDLLDNCVDGILRNTKKGAGKSPYKGYFAEIEFDAETFSIHDNCGGIPWKLRDYAFRMGGTSLVKTDSKPTVGVYGIGMKRAIFKIGRQCLIQTKNKSDSYEVEINEPWMNDQEDWDLPVTQSEHPLKKDGTTLLIGRLNPGAASAFDSEDVDFIRTFRETIATNYAFIISKGFQIKVNGRPIVAKPTELRFETKQSRGRGVIRPFIYTTSVDGVDVFLTVGFTRPIVSADDIDSEQKEKQYSSMDAGWTVICNDRAVLYCDRSILTGWGEASVPQYHTQFTSISGVVEFRSSDATKLPTTTTKRGIDASSPLYLKVKAKMREGMKLFTDFTYKWKGGELASQAQDMIRNTESFSVGDLKIKSKTLQMAKVSTGAKGKQYKPDLPRPPKAKSDLVRMTFTRPRSKIDDVAQYLFEDKDILPSEVAEGCFDVCYKEAWD